MVFKKTLVQVYTNQYPFGFPEFVRGTLFLLNYVNKNNMVLQLNLVNHALSEYVVVNNYDIHDHIPKVYYEDKDRLFLLEDLRVFQESSLPLFTVTTNIGIHKNEIDSISILQFNNLISFSQSIHDQVTRRLTCDLINARKVPSLRDPYNVINLYLADNKLDRSQIQSLSTQIRNTIDLSKTSIVVSSSEYLRRTLTGFLGGYHVLLSLQGNTLSPLEDSIIDFLVISKSKKIYTFTEYNHKLKKINYNVSESTSLSTITLPEQYYITKTLAGVYPEAEFTDGTSLTAAFAYPSGITEDSSGNVFIADTMNNNIRQIHQDTRVTTIAGSLIQNSGNMDGQGIAASFNGPTGLTSDASGNLYVLDAINGLIRRIDLNGRVTTIAGSTAGFKDGTGTTAKFKFVYATNPPILPVISPDQYYVATTFAGVYPESEFTDGTTFTAAFAYPCGITEDSLGNIFIADTMNNNIRQIYPDNTVVTLAGSLIQTPGNMDGQGIAASFNGPTGIISDDLGNLYVLDAINSVIRRIDSNGEVTTISGSTAGFQDGTGSSAKFNFVYATNP